MDLSNEPQRIRTFYLRTAQIIRKIRKNKSTMKTEVYKTDSPARYLALVHKVLLNYPVLNEISENLKLARDTAHGAVLAHEVLSGKLEGGDWKGKIENALNGRVLKCPQVKTHIRLNTIKWNSSNVQDGKDTPEGHKDMLDRLNKTCIPNVFELPKNPKEGQEESIFGNEELLSLISFQSLPSCLPAFLLNPPANSTVIDATAAPGNKTTHLASIMNNTGRIYAFDRDKKRVEILRKRVESYGAKNIEVIHKDFLTVSPEQYKADYVLVDPSCSGSGIHMNYEKDQKRIDTLHNFQVVILNHAFTFEPLRVVYSTCSYHSEEGEDVVQEVLEKNPTYEIEPIGDFWKERGYPGYSFSDMVARSGAVDGEKGFFVAVFRKKI